MNQEEFAKATEILHRRIDALRRVVIDIQDNILRLQVIVEVIEEKAKE